MQSLEGKVALITGSGRGIGAATARKLAAEGARVIVNDLDRAEAEQIAAALDGAIAAPADLTDADAADYLVNTAIEKLGGLDIVVNNAGIAPAGLRPGRRCLQTPCWFCFFGFVDVERRAGLPGGR